MKIDLSKTRWELRKDDAILGGFDQCGMDWPWVMCRFTATDEFETYRPLFAEETRLMDLEDKTEADDAAWEAAMDRLSQLGLTLVLFYEDKVWVYRNFMLHIRGEEGWFRLFPDGETPDLPLV